MNPTFNSLSKWTDDLFSAIDTVANDFNNSIVGNNSNSGYWVGDYPPSFPVDPWPTKWIYEPYIKFYPQIIEVITTVVKDQGSPWRDSPNFPPVNIDLNPVTKELRFTWALAGVRKDHDVEIEFDSDKLILHIKAKETDTETKDSEEVTGEIKWASLKQGIKTKVVGDYSYDVAGSRYDVAKAVAKWDDGLLTVTLPLREEAKPFKVQIQS